MFEFDFQIHLMKNKYLTIAVITGILSCFMFINETPVCERLSYYFYLIINNLLPQYITTSFFKVSKTNNEAATQLFTSGQLSEFDGRNGKLYLSILGQVFDVSRSKKHYGPGESYHGFTGKDGSKAFVTGEFTENGLTDDLSDLSLSDLNTLQDWLQLYKREYTFKGKLIGRFYSETGKSTVYLKEIEKKFQLAGKLNEDEAKNKEKYPPCNIEWTQHSGGRVWCSNKSGGIKRDWVGVPRKIFLPGWTNYKCACINPKSKQSFDDGVKIKEYINCKPNSESCYVGKN